MISLIVAHTIVFMCPHGGAKSVIAAAYFNQLAAAESLSYEAVAVAGEDPYDAVPENVREFLAREGFDVASFKPRCFTSADVESAKKVISIDCDIDHAAIERWDDVPKVSEDLPGSAAAIRKHVQALVDELK
jgi:protein-tyrosine-phosphatase